MDYYNILGIKENASKEEIQAAYEKQVKKIKEDVENEKRAKLFTKVLDEAYEALMKLEESRHAQQKSINSIEIDENKTMIMKPQEVQQELEKQKRVNSKIENSEAKKRTTKKSSNISTKNKSKSKKGYSDDRDSDNKNKDRKNNKQRVIKENKNSTTSNIMKVLMVPLKILALPIIAILSVIILLCKMINIVSWLASKVIIVGAIGVGAIHLYQINLGQVADKKLLFIVGVAVVASFFLPYILKVIPKVLGSLNDSLKNFVF